MKSYKEVNRQLWNDKTGVHLQSAFYDMESFRAGRSSLDKITLGQIEALQGKKLLHLQCHFGQDTLSLARLGAEVTGIDLSDKAIEAARDIARKMEIPAHFVRGDVLEADQLIKEKFDVIFTSYGTIGWLPEVKTWGKVIGQLLKPGGTFYLIDFHPFIWLFDDEFSKIIYPYFNRGPIEEVIEGSYADRNAPIKNRALSWPHTFADVFGTLLSNGLQIHSFEEFDYSPYDCFPNTIPCANGFQIRGVEGMIPMVFALQTKKLS